MLLVPLSFKLKPFTVGIKLPIREARRGNSKYNKIETEAARRAKRVT